LFLLGILQQRHGCFRLPVIAEMGGTDPEVKELRPEMRKS
jgi:hypothetical protein